MESVLEEFKSSTRESLETKQRVLVEWAKESKEIDAAEFRDALLDILSQTRTEYQVTVAEAKATDDIDRVAELWKETHDYYSAMLSLWQGVEALGATKDELFVYWGDLVKKLESASAEHYEFHASGDERPKVKLTAVFESCEEGGYHAFIPEIKGVHTQGETIKEATENLVDALGLFLLDKLEDKLSGIKPTDRIEIELTSSQSETTRA
jgi:predicted RNase H-like HicB family nuclease